MADIKKFLDQAGVSVLWSRIAEELEAKQTAIDGIKNTADTNKADITTMKGQIEALEKGTYDDSELRGLIGSNTNAIATLNGNAETVGSVAHTATEIAATKVAEIVAGADADFDTLKEIADWILNDTTGAADMANDIKALQVMLAGIEGTVVGEIATEIEAALKVEGVDKYALASDLIALADRVKVIEEAGYATRAEAEGYANTALADAKDYTNTEVAKIQALTETEIDAAITAASQA